MAVICDIPITRNLKSPGQGSLKSIPAWKRNIPETASQSDATSIFQVRAVSFWIDDGDRFQLVAVGNSRLYHLMAWLTKGSQMDLFFSQHILHFLEEAVFALK